MKTLTRNDRSIHLLHSRAFSVKRCPWMSMVAESLPRDHSTLKGHPHVGTFPEVLQRALSSALSSALPDREHLLADDRDWVGRRVQGSRSLPSKVSRFRMPPNSVLPSS